MFFETKRIQSINETVQKVKQKNLFVSIVQLFVYFLCFYVKKGIDGLNLL